MQLHFVHLMTAQSAHAGSGFAIFSCWVATLAETLFAQANLQAMSCMTSLGISSSLLQRSKHCCPARAICNKAAMQASKAVVQS